MKLLFVASLTLLTLSYLDQVDSSAYDKIVYHSRIRAKKQGPNMCALQQVMGTKKKYFSTCRNWYKGTICGKKAVVLYECCPGYMELEGMRGCPAASPIDNVYGTLGLLKADITKRYSDISKIKEEIDGSGTYTMFAPTDDAWDQLDGTARKALEGNVNNELYNALHYHMVNKRLLTKDLKNDLKLESMHNNQGLHINHYSNGIVTVNCARIIHANQVATNGVVHLIDRVISAVGSTIKEVINSNEELGSLSAAFNVESTLLEKLDQPGHYTLFAPTDNAFDSMDREVIERVLGDQTVLKAFLKYHLLNSMQCSEAIMSGSVYETLEGSNIEIGCDGDSLTVNGIKMVLKKDIVTSNGVIHLIDQVLMPDSAKQVTELVGGSQSTFGDMVSELGLSAAMGAGTQYTLLAPLNGVFTEEVMSMDQRLLKIILENHILKLKVTLSELYNGQLLETLGGNFLRVFIYRTAVCIENACMVRGSKEGSNGALHLLTSLIKMPKTTMYELLEADGRFTVFLSLMESAGLTELLKQEGAYTVFAPTDDAFDGLTEEDMTLLTNDVNALRTILLYHFSKGVFLNGGLEGGVTNMIKTIQGNNLQVLSVNNSIQVNSVNVPSTDLMASNGVVHVVKTLLYPGDLPVGREELLLLLRRLIKYIQIKFVAGYTYREIPLTFIKRIITTTHIVESVPEVKVIETDPSLIKVTRVIERQPTVTKVTIEGEPKFTKVTRVIESTGASSDGEIEEITKLLGEGSEGKVIETDPSLIKVTRVIERQPTVTKVTIEGNSTRTIRKKPIVKETVIKEDPKVSKIKVIEGDPTFTKVTRVIESTGASSDGEIEELTKLINEGGPGITTITKVIKKEPQIIEGPDFSQITSFKDNPDLIDAESERITKLIQRGGSQKRAAVRRSPAGMKKRVRLVRHHSKPSQ
ncbi:periostin isoform X1 [Astyanax mexicanus]|uniref:Periostin isoform X1 n=1 Tax=Astyanax mexicanus TaxID=7994 RepID=A0A8T2L3U2_ASTMX|nr:periostin isoform X1 [Astyanax mexicanus]